MTKFTKACDTVILFLFAATVAKGCYSTYTLLSDAKQLAEANAWQVDALDRMVRMRNYAVTNGISRQGFKDMATAAKNRIVYEASETNVGNPYMSEAAQKISKVLSQWEAEVA